MSVSIKLKLFQMLNDIEDETILNQVMEEVVFYASKDDILDSLTPAQLNELDIAIKEADDNKTVSLDEFKIETNEWRKK